MVLSTNSSRISWSEVKWSGLVVSDTATPMDSSLPGSSHGIFQARVLEWVATESLDKSFNLQITFLT